MEGLKLKDLKDFLEKLTPNELEQDLLYNSKEFSISGNVLKICKSKSNLYWDGEDDPSTLKTLKELRDEGYEKDEIEEMEIQIKKGDVLIEF